MVAVDGWWLVGGGWCWSSIAYPTGKAVPSLQLPSRQPVLGREGMNQNGYGGWWVVVGGGGRWWVLVLLVLVLVLAPRSGGARLKYAENVGKMMKIGKIM